MFEGELSIAPGDAIYVTKQMPNGAWEARINGRTGTVPGNLVLDRSAPTVHTAPLPYVAPPPLMATVPQPPYPVALPVYNTSLAPSSSPAFLPPVDPSAPPETQTPLERKVAVDYNGETRFLKLRTTSLDDLILSLREQLKVSTSMTVSYFDSEMDSYGLLDSVDDLPANKIKLKVVTQTMSWWGWSVDSTSWATKGFETTRYSSLLVKEGPHIHHQPALDKFNLVAAMLGFDPRVVTKVFAISNDKLLTNFENYRDTLYAKHRANPGLFKKEEWMTMPEAEQRKKFINWHSDFSDKFPWNDKTRPRVIPMLQGTSEGAVWQICQQGFGVVGTTDDGYYGAGVYFTSKLRYASQYARAGADGNKSFIVSMVIPGNSFPVVEHPFAAAGSSANPSGFKAKACRGGYQSHFTLVDGMDINDAFPLTEDIDPDTVADELITFDTSQALPLFVFYTQ